MRYLALILIGVALLSIQPADAGQQAASVRVETQAASVAVQQVPAIQTLRVMVPQITMQEVEVAVQTCAPMLTYGTAGVFSNGYSGYLGGYGGYSGYLGGYAGYAGLAEPERIGLIRRGVIRRVSRRIIRNERQAAYQLARLQRLGGGGLIPTLAE